MTDIEVLNVLGIDDFRHMTKEKIVSFASLLDQMDPRVAEKALDQFPNFANTIVSLALDYKEVLGTMVGSNVEIASTAINVCQSIIDCLSNQVRDSQTFEEKKYYLSLMKQLADDTTRIAAECQKNNSNLVEKAGVVLLVLAGLLGCALGFKGHITPVVRM